MNRLWLMICLLITLGTAGQAYASEATAPVYLNGEKSDLQALVVNGTSYLPLRNLAETFRLSITWDQQEKMAELCLLDRRTRVWQTRGTYGTPYMVGEEEHWYEQKLEAAPLARQGRIWLPLRFFEGLTEAKIYWDEELAAVCVDGIPIYQGYYYDFKPDGSMIWHEGHWTYSASQWAQPRVAFDEEGFGWTVLREGSPIMGTDYLWRLEPQGWTERVTSHWRIADWKVLGDVCYCLVSVNTMIYDYFEVHQVDRNTKEETVLGEPGFVYNVGVRLLNGGEYIVGDEQDLPVGWWVDSGGVWAVGLRSEAITDYGIGDVELARESYGLYRLYPGGHELVKKYDLPE